MDQSHETQPLALAGGTARTTFAEMLPPGLWRLLHEGDNYREAVRLIAINPTLAAQLSSARSAIEAAAAPADPVGLMRLLIEEGSQYGLRDRSEGEYAALYGSYLDSLAPVPLACVKDAFVLWGRAKLYPTEPKRHAYMPTSGELYILAERSWEPLRKAAYRAKAAAEFKEALPKPPPTASEIAEVRRMLAEFNGGLRQMPEEGRPHSTKHEVAERLRRAAEKRS